MEVIALEVKRKLKSMNHGSPPHDLDPKLEDSCPRKWLHGYPTISIFLLYFHSIQYNSTQFFMTSRLVKIIDTSQLALFILYTCKVDRGEEINWDY